MPNILASEICMVKGRARHEGKVELSVSIPVEEKLLGDTYRGDGFSPRDLATFDFTIVVTEKVLADLVGNLAVAHCEVRRERNNQIDVGEPLV